MSELKKIANDIISHIRRKETFVGVKHIATGGKATVCIANNERRAESCKEIITDTGYRIKVTVKVTKAW